MNTTLNGGESPASFDPDSTVPVASPRYATEAEIDQALDALEG